MGDLVGDLRRRHASSPPSRMHTLRARHESRALVQRDGSLVQRDSSGTLSSLPNHTGEHKPHHPQTPEPLTPCERSRAVRSRDVWAAKGIERSVIGYGLLLFLWCLCGGEFVVTSLYIVYSLLYNPGAPRVRPGATCVVLALLSSIARMGDNGKWGARAALPRLYQSNESNVESIHGRPHYFTVPRYRPA